MKAEFLAKSPLLALPLGALFFFLFVFAAVVFVTMRRKAPAYDPIARLPFDEGDAKQDDSADRDHHPRES